MSIDQTLLESVQAGAPPALRLYRWAEPCLSLGRNQPARDRFRDAARLAASIVRRPTGGLAVYHDRELTYAVAVPVGWLGGPRATYHAINRSWIDALRRLGVAAGPARSSQPTARAAPAPHPASPDPTCFAAAAPGEVMVRGRKLIGSAQRCERHAILQHGSLPLEAAQQTMVRRLAGADAVAGASLAAIALAEAAGRVVPMPELIDAVVAGFTATLGIRLAPAVLSPPERLRAAALADQRFGTSAWTWRR